MKTLLLIDVQKDFLPGGSLPIEGADEILPIINRLMPSFDCVLATKDWHPPHHVSFAKTHGKRVGEAILIGGVRQILWPVHCVQNTEGAAFPKELEVHRIEAVFHKGTDPDIDSYSAFFDQARKRATGLAEYLETKRYRDLYFAGLATDYCVLYSVLDALEWGFRATVMRDACRAVELHPGDGENALKRMEKRGARVVLSVNL